VLDAHAGGGLVDLRFWNTIATSRAPGSSAVMSLPFMRTVPASACSSPARMRKVVVFPEPEGPKSEKNSPGLTSRSMPPSAVTAPWRLTMPERQTEAALICVRRPSPRRP
jgi:hypothetical protein